MRKVAIEMNLRLNCAVRRDDTHEIFVATCPALGLYSQGVTSDEAKAAIEEAAILFVKHSFNRSILDDVLNARGFEAVPEASLPALEGAAESIHIKSQEFDDEFPVTVPLHLLMAAQAAAACQP